ncbi:MAG: bifunctional heptose 7-phosphate kinase/heptose 1-phosphate adenyltransferase [Bacteroidales bacterium]
MSFSKIQKLDFSKAKILVIGDVMLDKFIFGNVNRMSPEANVPILDVNSILHYLGGAANVASNLKSLNIDVNICSVVGNDEQGDKIINLLDDININTNYIYKSDFRKTTIKARAIDSEKQLIRLDIEDTFDLNSTEYEILKKHIVECINNTNPDIIILQDYDKGIFNKKLINFIIDLALDNNIRISVDPKRKHFNEYKNVFLFKPNLKEFNEYLHTQSKDFEFLGKKMLDFQNSNNIELFMLTLGSNGILISKKSINQIWHIPTNSLVNAYVSGAGDSVISIASGCLAINLDFIQTAIISNIAGRLACTKRGIASITVDELNIEIEKHIKQNTISANVITLN